MNYLNSPNLPQKTVGTVIMQTYDNYDTASFGAVSVPACKVLPVPEQYHADMQIIHIRDNIFVCAQTVFEYYKKMLPDAEIYSGKVPGNIYPYNIAFNACIIGDKIFCNSKHTDSTLLEKAKESGLFVTDVKQGYTKCSTAVVSQNAVITSDKGLCKIYKENGIDVLQIREGHIVLKGYNHGFIGGCCGKTDKDILWFNGDITSHPDYNAIRDFCNKYGCRIKYSGGFPLTDIGSILPIAYK